MTKLKAIGPYSLYREAGDLVFVAGQIGIDFNTEKLKNTIGEQTEQVIDNIAAILAEVNLTLDNVVQATLYLTNMDDRDIVNEVYATKFSGKKPTRATVEVSSLPAGALIEIEVIASKTNG